MSSSSPHDSERERDAQDIVTLSDAAGRSLDCYVENEIIQAGVEYYLLMPVDQPIIVLAWDEDDDDEVDDIPETELVDHPDDLAQIFPDAKAVLAELDLTLQDTAHVMTVRGELPPLDETKILSLEIEEEGLDLEPEELQELTKFYYLEQLYCIYAPVEPIPLFVKVTGDEEMELLDAGDPMIEALIDTLILQDAQ